MMRDLLNWFVKDDKWIIAVMNHNRGQFTDEFRKWLPLNLHVFAEFCKRARKLKRSGINHYGAKAIVEIVRYHTAIRQKGDESFKLNNDFTSYLSRLSMMVYKDLDGFFETRAVTKVYENQMEE